ncbi:hypothetical protein AgCh_028515 [Apium graveolens]
MPDNKTKGEIEARLARSRSSTQQVQGAEKSLNQEVDLDMERLIRAAKGPSMSREFDELLKALKASLNNNHFTYKKALDKTINFLRVIMVTQDNFLQKRIMVNTNDSRKDRCMQMSLNYLVSRRAYELDILINKVRVVTHEDTLLLAELKNAHVATFPEAYLQPSKGITYICPNTKHFKHFQIPKQCVMANKKLIMILETGLKSKKNKNFDDVEMIKFLGRYLSDAEANLPKTQINKDNLDDDEQKKDDQNPFGSNPSQSTKPYGSKDGEKKKEDDKKNDEKKRASERKSKRRHDGSEPQQTLKLQTAQTQSFVPTTSIKKPLLTSKTKFLYKQTANSFLKIQITTSQTILKKITTLPLANPSIKVNLKSVGRKPKKAKSTEKVEVAERAIWNCFKQSDFLSLKWCISDDDYFQQLSEEIVRVWLYL